MTKHIFYCIAALIAMFACENTPPMTAASPFVPQTASVIPDKELLEALRGRWQSEEDGAYALEIRDDKMKRIYAGQVTEECALEAFSNCKSIPCKADSAFVSGAWCFTEKGLNGLQCNRILKCDSLLLQFETAGKTDIFKFKKIQP